MLAGRLAEADPELSILVIEGGQNNFNVPNVVNPLLYWQHLLPTSKTALFYKAKASEHLAGRESIVPSGGSLLCQPQILPNVQSWACCRSCSITFKTWKSTKEN